MFDATIVNPAFQQLIGWREHFDPTDITVAAPLQVSETGEFYQQKHPALRLDIIQTLLPENQDLDVYLAEVVKDSVNEMLNDLLSYRQVSNYGKTLLETTTLLNKYGWINDKITNLSRFVGFQIKVKSVSGLKTVIQEIGLQMDSVEDLTLYLYHSQKKDALASFNITTQGSGQWDWNKDNAQDLAAFKEEYYHGGVFILGYYQDDLNGAAINYTDFDFEKGVCGSCNSSHAKDWRSIKGHFHIYPIYVPDGSYTVGEMFDLNDAIYDKDHSWGMNLKLKVECDLTEFFVQNKFHFKNLLSWKVVYKILNMMKFSQEINAIEENIKMMIIRDLEGDIDTKLVNVPTQYHRELKSVNFNIEGINSKCLPCAASGYAPTYGVV